MKKNLLNKLWLRVGMIVAIMTTALAGTVKAETYNVTYSYADLKDMLYGNYLDASSYWKVPETAGNTAVISIPITNQPTSDITVTYKIATFGSGTNPSSSNTTITAVGTETGSNWSGSGVSSYPSSSTYVNGVMTIAKPNNPTTLAGLDITMGVNSGVKIFRLQSVTISYTYGGGTPTPTTYNVTYDANGGTGTMVDENSPYEANEEVTLLTNTFTAPEGKLWSSWSVKDASNNDITVTNGKFTMPASNVTVTAQWVDDPNAPQYEWVLTDWSDLQEGDIFVIVGNGTKAMDNSVVSSNPSATSVTIANGKITSSVSNNLMWNRSAVDGGYQLVPNGSTTNRLNNPSGTNLRVDNKTTNSSFTYTTYSNNNYLLVGDRYVCIYNNSDWRAYKSSNIVETNTTFYKRQVVSNEPSISANDVNIAYNATSGSIDYTLENATGNVSASITAGDWLTLGTITSSVVPFTCTANPNTTVRTATVTLTYGSVTKDVTVTQAAAPVTSDWVVTALADLTEDDIFVIVGNNGSTYAMSNDKGTSTAPAAVAVTISGDYLTGTVPQNIQWNISGNATDGYVFYPNGESTKWLYCTNSNNGVRVGTNADNKLFTLNDGYLYNGAVSRYVGIYNSSDWRCYTSTTTNINDQTFAFYKYVGTPLPVINASDVEIAYNATSGSISYEVENPVTGGTLTASTEADWLTLGTAAATTVPFTASANENSVARTASVTLTYTYGTETTTKSITVTQAGNPEAQGGANNPYTVTQALAVINALEDGSRTDYVYTTGTIKAIEEVETEQYFNATYTISDGTSDLLVFRGYYLNNAHFESADQIHVGDVVVVYGKLLKFVKDNVTTPEIAQSNYIVSQAQTVTVTSAGYATMVAAANLVIPTGVEVYAAKVNEGATSAQLTAVTEGIPSGAAVLVKASEGTHEFTYTNETVAEIANNDLKASTVAFNPAAENTIYCLANKSKGIGFYPVATTVTIPAGKAYLNLSAVGGVKAFYGFEEEDPTGIDNLNANANANEGAIYNLSGQMVNGKLPKGIYIVNGKKILK